MATTTKDGTDTDRQFLVNKYSLILAIDINHKKCVYANLCGRGAFNHHQNTHWMCGMWPNAMRVGHLNAKRIYFWLFWKSVELMAEWPHNTMEHVILHGNLLISASDRFEEMNIFI